MSDKPKQPKAFKERPEDKRSNEELYADLLAKFPDDQEIEEVCARLKDMTIQVSKPHRAGRPAEKMRVWLSGEAFYVSRAQFDFMHPGASLPPGKKVKTPSEKECLQMCGLKVSE